MPVPEAQKKIQGQKLIPFWSNLLLKNGVPVDKLPLVLSQIIFESDWFTSKAYLIDLNPGGITWNDKYINRPGASIGRKRAEGGNYVHFDSFDSAAKDYVRIINKNNPQYNLGKPIDSLNYVDYAKRLKANGYYGSPVEIYTGGLKSAFTRITNWFPELLKKKTISVVVALVYLTAGIWAYNYLKKRI
jgi:hypothetical protein